MRPETMQPESTRTEAMRPESARPETMLPEAFQKRMQTLLGTEYDAFLASFSRGRENALRLNRRKLTPEQFEAQAPFPVKRVPWTDNGYYVDYRDAPGRHPWYRAGVYYLQEPSAMAPAQILPVSPGDRVLDLCAAPGGKATELGARLGGKGLLVANEISASRARALERNVELFGITNCVVSNEPPARLLERFEGYFDRILVDAPCSGEGMFRKDPEAVKAWYPEKPEDCARIQREIILQAADMLERGGYLVYSTCTFEPVENELVIRHLLCERPEMELVDIPCTGGRESFRKAFSLSGLQEAGFLNGADGQGRDGLPEDGQGLPDAADEAIREAANGGGCEAADGEILTADVMQLDRAVRIWPHLCGGEGHFIALLRKRGSAGARKKHPARAGSRKGCEGMRPAGGSLSKQERMLVEGFLEGYLPGQNIDMNRCEKNGGRVYLMPEGCPDIRGLRFLRAGLYLGELKKNRFEPSQELALALPTAGIPQPMENGTGICAGGGSHIRMDNGDHICTDDGTHICLDPKDARLSAFLRGEAAVLPPAAAEKDKSPNPHAADTNDAGSDPKRHAGLDAKGHTVPDPQGGAGQNGWRLVCADRFPVGWGKLTGGVLKNHIPAAWRSTL